MAVVNRDLRPVALRGATCGAVRPGPVDAPRNQVRSQRLAASWLRQYWRSNSGLSSLTPRIPPLEGDPEVRPGRSEIPPIVVRVGFGSLTRVSSMPLTPYLSRNQPGSES